jgi:hypothetical protein
MPRRRILIQLPRSVQTAYPAAAGTWRASQPNAQLLRPPSPGIEAYTRQATVPIGNDGIATPVSFPASGTAQLSVGPSGIGASWAPVQANAYTSIGQLDPSAVTIYVGPLPVAQYEVAQSLSGGGAQVALGGVTLVPGWFVWAVWTGGTEGATASLYVTGAKTVLTAQ